MLENKMEEERKRIVISLIKCPDFTYAEVEDLLAKCNSKEYGRELELEDLFVFFIRNCTDKEIKAIQEEYLDPWDKVEKLYITEIKDKGLDESFKDFVARKMKV